jgi:hypothetical protein
MSAKNLRIKVQKIFLKYSRLFAFIRGLNFSFALSGTIVPPTVSNNLDALIPSRLAPEK